jgi:hypothetical protein
MGGSLRGVHLSIEVCLFTSHALNPSHVGVVCKICRCFVWGDNDVECFLIRVTVGIPISFRVLLVRGVDCEGSGWRAGSICEITLGFHSLKHEGPECFRGVSLGVGVSFSVLIVSFERVVLSACTVSDERVIFAICAESAGSGASGRRSRSGIGLGLMLSGRSSPVVLKCNAFAIMFSVVTVCRRG